MCSRTPSDFAFGLRQNGLVGQADERVGAEGNRPRSGRAAALLGFGQVRPTSRRRSTITMRGGRSRRRPEPEPAQAAVPLDHREFAGPARRALGGKSRWRGCRSGHIRGRSGQLLSPTSSGGCNEGRRREGGVAAQGL
jgi:hypothetical protein